MDGKMSLERRKDGSMMGMNDEFRTEGGKDKKHCMNWGAEGETEGHEALYDGRGAN